jgi:hypothetical protein
LELVVAWVYRNNYAGPDRRSGQFQVRFLERRRENAESAPTLVRSLQDLFARGLRWVDHFNYFGPDRRGGDFSYYFFERRRTKSVSEPPPLPTALRQLRVRVANAKDAEALFALEERLTATALLAEAQGFEQVATALTSLAARLAAAQDGGPITGDVLHDELGRIEAMLV